MRNRPSDSQPDVRLNCQLSRYRQTDIKQRETPQRTNWLTKCDKTERGGGEEVDREKKTEREMAETCSSAIHITHRLYCCAIMPLSADRYFSRSNNPENFHVNIAKK